MVNIIKDFDIEPCDDYVYIHKRATDGSVFYVGKGRKGRYKSKNGRSAFWTRVGDKYGVVVSIVQDRLQEWAALELEKDLIALYGRFDLAFGNLVNHTDGGDGKCGAIPTPESNLQRSRKLLGRVFSEQHKSLIGAANRKRKMSASSKKKISDSRIGKYAGENHPMYGKKKTKESIEKTASKIRLKVLCIETGVVFKSVTEAAAFIGTSTSHLSRTCKGYQATCKGFTWCYFSEDTTEPQQP